MRAVERSILTISILLLLAAFIQRLVTRGGPYFERPATIVDHVGPNGHETRDALILLPRIRRLLPHGATVTCFRPINGAQQYDSANFLAAVGQLPEQSVLPPFAASLDTPRDALVQYVIAIRLPFTHPAYRVIAEFPEGRLYEVVR